MGLLFAMPPKCALDQSGQLVGGTSDGILYAGCLMGDRDRLTTFESRLHHASRIVRTAVVTIFVTEVNFHSRDVAGEEG